MRLLPPRWIDVSYCRSSPAHGGAEHGCRSFSNCRKFGTPMPVYIQIHQWFIPGLILAIPPLSSTWERRGEQQHHMGCYHDGLFRLRLCRFCFWARL